MRLGMKEAERERTRVIKNRNREREGGRETDKKRKNEMYRERKG